MSQSNFINLVRQRLRQLVGIYAVILIPMWVMFALDHTLLFRLWSGFGIEPRTFDIPSMVGIVASWTMHGNLAHIIGNTTLLIQILFLFALFEKNVFITIAKLIIASGVATWVLGASHSSHIGASGLCFAMLGFMIGGAVFARRWGYLIACVLMGAGFWYVISIGLVPQTGISFAAHFGGLVVGLLLGATSKHDYPSLTR